MNTSKTSPRSATLLAAAVASATLLVTSFAQAATTTYKLDLQPEASNPVADGFTTIAAGSFNTPIVSKNFELGNDISITFENFRSYGTANMSNALITDGFIAEGPNATSSFTISGLTNGSTVTLYAIGAWDGPGRAAFVAFDGSAFVDTASKSFIAASDQPGNVLTSADFQLIADNVSVVGTSISGSWSAWSNGNGLGSERAEGQLGGLWIEIISPDTPAVPEPATYAFILGFGALAFIAFRRRR